MGVKRWKLCDCMEYVAKVVASNVGEPKNTLGRKLALAYRYMYFRAHIQSSSLSFFSLVFFFFAIGKKAAETEIEL